MIRNKDTTAVPLVRLSAINPFLRELAARGFDAGKLLERHKLPQKVPASSDLFVSAHTMYSLVEGSAALAKDPYMGASVGERLDLLAWEPIAEAASEATSVGELLHRFIVSARTHASTARYTLKTSHDRATFRIRRALPPPSAPEQNDAFYVGWVTRLLLGATGDRWKAEDLLISVANPAVLPSTLIGSHIVPGDHSGFRISFPTEWLFEPFDRVSFVSRIKADTNTHMPMALVDSIRQAIEPHIHEEQLTVARAAELCGLEQRHLSRRLKKKGTTLAREIARLRRKKAAHALVHSDQRIADIAGNVGFTDPTVFSRAFKNWTGKSPQAYRREHRL